MIGREQGAGREESVPITRAPSVLIRYKSLHIVGYTTYASFDTCISPRTFNPHCNRLPATADQIFLVVSADSQQKGEPALTRTNPGEQVYAKAYELIRTDQLKTTQCPSKRIHET